jgi:hypothetical protein
MVDVGQVTCRLDVTELEVRVHHAGHAPEGDDAAVGVHELDRGVLQPDQVLTAEDGAHGVGILARGLPELAQERFLLAVGDG